MTPENLTGPQAMHAEAPVWSAEWHGLRYVDGDAGDLLTLRSDGVHRLHIDDDYAAFARPRVGGGYVALGKNTLYLADEADDVPEAIHQFDLGHARFNDGTVDPNGRLMAGSMSLEDGRAIGKVVRLGYDLADHTILTDVTISNGIGFSPDGTRCFYIDTPTGRIDQFDVIDGELFERRPFATIADGDGFPDGLTVASDGTVWVALWAGSAVNGYSPDGRLIERITLPVPQVTAVAFGGENLDELFITTSAQGLGNDHGTDAGSVYRVNLGVTGLPVIPFNG